MSLRKHILIIIFGFFTGTFVNSFINLDFWFAFFLLSFAIIFILLRYLKYRSIIFLIISLFLIGVSFGILRYEAKDLKINGLDKFINQKISFEGIITEEPQEKENYTHIIVKTSEEKILMYIRLYPKFKYGDKILITGKLQKPKKFGNSISEKFDWPAYLAKDDIHYQIFYPEIKFISSNNNSYIKEKLFDLKNSFVQNLEKVIPSPASSLMAGIVIGEKQSLPKNLKNNLIKTGLVHIVVLSGYNITIIANAIINILKIFSLPRFFSAIFGTISIIIFTLMTGAEAATVRAAIMALLVILALQTGRMYTAINALIFAAFFMVLINPAILRFDASFQLSFLATFGMIYFTPKFEKWLYFLPNKFKLKETASGTLAAQTAVLPLLILKTGSISLISLPLNILIVNFIPLTMFLGFLTGALGFLSQILSLPFGILSYLFLTSQIFLINFSANLPFAYIKILF